MDNMEAINKPVDNEYSFWKLVTEYSIEIPIIQRDYAQGRISKNETAIRNDLLESINNALLGGTHLDFDFVYGTVEDGVLYPLDGQQRLTTLFLLHWYLAEKENKIESFRSILHRFSYTTRVSSRTFCDVLVNMDYVPEADVKPSFFIKDQNKYFRNWDSDPTIIAMLQMLDAIHEKFFLLGPVFDVLTSDNAPITFHYLPMEQYALTDDLYIKMNARGKALSVFENFKAKFIQHLRKNDLPVTHFESNIDGKWIDLLWDYRAKDNTIDAQFMNLFCYFTEMIFLLTEESTQFGDSPFKVNDIRGLIDYYLSEEKVNLLYDLLDLWSNGKEICSYLNKVLCLERESGKVRLFDTEGTVNVFSQIVNGKQVSLANKILLFGIMMRLIKLGKDTDLSSMTDFIRLSRNFIIKNRAFIKSDCRFEPDLRFRRQGPIYTKFIVDQLCTADNVYKSIDNELSYKDLNSEIVKQEKRKAHLIETYPSLKPIIQALEDLDCFRSCIFNILDYVEETEDETLPDELETLFTSENSVKIIQALLSIGDYGIKFGGSYLGDRYFYGNKEQWYEILSYPGDADYKSIICDFIWLYQTDESKTITGTLDNIINTNFKRIDITDWRYCLIKYDSTLEDAEKLYKPKIAFAFDNKGTAIVLHRMNKLSLLSSHTVPEYIEAARQLKNKCNSDIYGTNAEDAGKLEIVYKTPDKAYYDAAPWVVLNEDAEPSILCYPDNEIETMVRAKAKIKYARMDTKNKDNVEKLVIMGNLVYQELKDYYDSGNKQI